MKEHVAPYDDYLALILYVAYVLWPLAARDPLRTIEAAVLALIPAACIWWPDFMADTFRGLRPSQSPEFVYALGWIVMLMPLAVLAYLWLTIVG